MMMPTHPKTGTSKELPCLANNMINKVNVGRCNLSNFLPQSQFCTQSYAGFACCDVWQDAGFDTAEKLDLHSKHVV